MLVTITLSSAPDTSSSYFIANNLMLLKYHFCWFRTSALDVERQRTNLKIGSISETAIKMPRWKKVKYNFFGKSAQIFSGDDNIFAREWGCKQTETLNQINDVECGLSVHFLGHCSRTKRSCCTGSRIDVG